MEAINHLAVGRSVMVAAPTGTGKTVVAEYAVHRAQSRGRRAFYTTPIKALSNQKYRDLAAIYPGRVGLLTGDVVENPGGQIMVMTTEVVRNMLIQRPEDLADVDCIVFDEIHFLADQARGTTWEEAIICAPAHVQFVCLSATVKNTQQIADWIAEVHGPIELIEHRGRPVPLESFYFFDDELLPMIDADGRANSALRGIGGEGRRGIRVRGFKLTKDRRADGRPTPRPIDIVRHLRARNLLPGLFFFFSRRDCESASESCTPLGLTTDDQAFDINAHLDTMLSDVEGDEQALGQVTMLRRLLPQGVGFHHAGLLPVLKVLVEDLFTRGLLSVVFATDTLSLGINMPAKTVVIGELTKFDGESRRPLTPNEYQQLTGRAGRRGLDERGVAVVPYSPWVSVEDAMAIGTGALEPIESTFTLRYNTVLSLWEAGPNPTDRLARLFASSLREFQIDHDMRGFQLEIGGIDEALRSTPIDKLMEPVRGREARRLVGQRGSGQATRRDLLEAQREDIEQTLERARRLKRGRARRLLQSLGRVLEQFHYLEDGRPTAKVAGFREMYDGNGLILLEAVTRGILNDATPAEIAEAVSWFCFDRDKAFFNRFRIPPNVWSVRQKVERIRDEVLRAESGAGLSLTPGFNAHFSGIAYAWCQGIEFADLLAGINLPEGDVMMTFSKTLDLMRQMREATRMIDPFSPLLSLLTEADRRMRRGIVAICCSVGVTSSSKVSAIPEAIEVTVDLDIPNANPIIVEVT